MCGIAGIVAWKPSPNLNVEVDKMIGNLVHRGPDDQGIWCDNDAGVGLGQRRLAIIDLSEHGHQPMLSSSGRWVVSYNGEIYNFMQLRHELEDMGLAPEWRGHSDTEILLACVEAWGIEATLRKLVGMFAISIWDRRERTLTLARDRMGEKPLYYGVIGNRLLFGSELKALTAVAGPLAIDRAALSEYLRFSYVPAPLSIWEGIKKLRPGHFLTLRSTDISADESASYWDIGKAANPDLRKELQNLADRDIEDRVAARLSDSVKLQMVSDVPLGAFLSGGVDSSLVVALMQQYSSRPVRTFTIGFDQPEWDEAPFAADVAKHLGTDHTELYVSPRDAEQLIPELPHIYDEPFADSSQIPTVLVSRMTREHVTVALSGDGGDELFAGYPRYSLTENLWQKTSRIPFPVRQLGSRALCGVSPATLDKWTSHIVPASKRQMINGRRLHRLGQLMRTKSLSEMYLRLMSQWQPEDALVIGGSFTDNPRKHWNENLPAMEAMRRWDIAQYLPDDLMVKVDRAAMSASLETRAPMLDYRLVELAFSLPDRVLFENGVGKKVLRNILYRHVPRHLIDRPKAGFSVPLGDWLKGPLRDWAEEMLDAKSLDADGLLDTVKVRSMWNEHVSDRYDRSSYLWNILMFQAWLRQNSVYLNAA